MREKLQELLDKLGSRSTNNTKMMQVLEDLGKIRGDFSDESGAAHDLHVVEMCQMPIETYNIETRRTKKFKLDTGAPKSVAEIDWSKQYCLDQGIEFG